ncbi:Clavaminate synthase-like protein [Byssothecium circinans]|uniref:Clavaminate synthase-like protein n=1 Tax=Byssothecium circinans TaxID=147558 RepID=A0A6A5U9T1_9PLEO|nr:Clavaminate synthase-like protein [Byssothecium circinans]
MVLLERRTRGSTKANSSQNSYINDQDLSKQSVDIKDSDNSPLSSEPPSQTLSSIATTTELSTSIGTVLSGIQLSDLKPSQLVELSHLVADRGVVLLRHQNLDHNSQDRNSQHFGPVAKTPPEEDAQDDAEEEENEWRTDNTFSNHSPSYSILRISDDHTEGGETAFTSQYGLYDALSTPMQNLLDGLNTISPSQHKNPAVRTHPLTKLKALNVLPSSVARFAELKRKESENLLHFLSLHLNSSDAHTLRWKWQAGDVAIYDNRAAAYKHISVRPRSFTKTVSHGDKAYFDPASESRAQRTQRVAQEAKEKDETVKARKARFNNTPLRRILERQLSPEANTYLAQGQAGLEDTLPPSSTIPQDEKKSGRADSVFSDGENAQDHISAVRSSESAEKRTERWTEEVINGYTSPAPASGPAPATKSKTKGKSNTPLRRIIERQVSSHSPRRISVK